MSIFDQWEWGYCHVCGRDIEMVPLALDETQPELTEQQLRIGYHTSTKSTGAKCTGSSHKPTTKPKELTRDQEAALDPGPSEET